jgi:hypothetical protein
LEKVKDLIFCTGCGIMKVVNNVIKKPTKLLDPESMQKIKAANKKVDLKKFSQDVLAVAAPYLLPVCGAPTPTPTNPPTPYPTTHPSPSPTPYPTPNPTTYPSPSPTP